MASTGPVRNKDSQQQQEAAASKADEAAGAVPTPYAHPVNNANTNTNEPFAAEAKEFVRVHTIGKWVCVWEREQLCTAAIIIVIQNGWNNLCRLMNLCLD